MAKQSAFMARIQKAQEIREEQARHFARIFELDMVTLALGRMGFREAKFKEFDKVLAEVANEYGRDILEDSKEDAELWYSKSVMDREIKQYVGSLFVPYDERYKGVMG